MCDSIDQINVNNIITAIKIQNSSLTYHNAIKYFKIQNYTTMHNYFLLKSYLLQKFNFYEKTIINKIMEYEIKELKISKQCLQISHNYYENRLKYL